MQAPKIPSIRPPPRGPPLGGDGVKAACGQGVWNQSQMRTCKMGMQQNAVLVVLVLSSGTLKGPPLWGGGGQHMLQMHLQWPKYCSTGCGDGDALASALRSQQMALLPPVIVFK